MNATETLHVCRQNGIFLEVTETGGLRYRGEQQAVNRLLQSIRDNKEELLELIRLIPNEGNDKRHSNIRSAVKYSLSDWYGNPPQQGGGFLLGALGDTAENLLDQLHQLYGRRLVSTLVIEITHTR